MVTDHSKTNSQLKELIASRKVKAVLPSEKDSSHRAKLDKLKGLSGAAFDKQYASDQQRGP
jgi:putative membrane protein